EAQTKTPCIRGCWYLGLAKSLKYVRQERSIDAPSVVRHRQLPTRGDAFERHAHQAPFRGKFKGVRYKVPDDLLYPRWIGEGTDCVAPDLQVEGNISSGGRGAETSDYLQDHLTQIAIRSFEAKLPRHDTSDVE